jgi:hypothetical protein
VRNAVGAALHTIGYVLLTSAAIWLIFRYAP